MVMNYLSDNFFMYKYVVLAISCLALSHRLNEEVELLFLSLSLQKRQRANFYSPSILVSIEMKNKLDNI